MRNEAIARIFALRDCRKREAAGDFGGHVLHAVNGQIDRSSEERVLQLLDEHSLGSNQGDGAGLKVIAAGADANQLRLNAVRFGQARADMIRLPKSERAAARSDPQRLHFRSSSLLLGFSSRSRPAFSSARPNRWRRASIAPSR